jgi:hypothetical protein
VLVHPFVLVCVALCWFVSQNIQQQQVLLQQEQTAYVVD